MVNRVKNSAMPIKTTLGGVCCVPIAVRRKENETIYLVNEVIITSIGSTVITGKVSVADMHAWLKEHPDTFIAAFAD